MNPDDYSAEIDAISDALHRIGVSDAPRLVDRISGLGEELTRLRKAAQERDGLREEVERLTGHIEAGCTAAEIRLQDNARLTTERDSLRQQLDDSLGENRSWEAECDNRGATIAALRQQLEAAQRPPSLAERRTAHGLAPPSIEERANNLTDIVEQASARFDSRPIERASIEARRELKSTAEQLDVRDQMIAELHLERDDLHAGKEALRAELAAAQQRVAELEAKYGGGALTQAECVLAARNLGVDITCGRCAGIFYTGHAMEPHCPTCATSAGPDLQRRVSELAGAGAAAVLEAVSNLRDLVAAQRRIAQLEQHVDAAGRELKLQDATLRAIAPVYRAAGLCERMEFRLADALVTARAALTPEQLELIERMTAQPEVR